MVATMAGLIRIGCSGWQYRHWRELFYPDGLAQKRWFAHYAESFATVEINASFYRVPQAATFTGWFDKAPPGFRYAVKANRFITHTKKLKDVAEPLAEFLLRTRGLKQALGPVLYQLPPRWRADDVRLAEFLALLPPDLEHALEFREPSWMSERVLGMLDAAGVGFCVHDLHGSPPTPRVATGRLAYLRLHGAEGKYWGRYSPEQLEGWRDWCLLEAERGRDVWVYFNNDIHGHAIEDARALEALVRAAEPR